MRTSLTVVGLNLLCLGPACGQTANESTPAVQRPNVIVMMADDMGMGDTSAYQDVTGNRDRDQVHTPGMERLARLGVRYTDAHTPSSRCSATRYGLLTGRYPWRNRLKHWVLFGVQGDPMIERDRPTIGTLFQQHGYRTALVGKWHVGLRYRQADGRPADAWQDADLTQPMFDTPLDHGFEFCRFTSRSHGTSGPGSKNKRNGPQQSVGPGHVHGREVVGATGNGKQLVREGDHAYLLNKLGSRHFNHAMQFLRGHLSDRASAKKPFLLYYPSNSNHGPHTPDHSINGVEVAGAARNVVGQPMNTRSDYIFENDVALGQLIDFLQQTDDPRRPGTPLVDNTIVIFTSDNGAEIKAKTATGPFRSNKGSVYEGGHRVPFLVAWPAGGVGDGDQTTDGRTDSTLMGLHDLYATFVEVLGADMPDLLAGQKGGEDSTSVLAAWQGGRVERGPMFFNDHNEADDRAASAIRLDNPIIDGQVITGKWKLFLDAGLLRKGLVNPTQLYDLATDPMESRDLLKQAHDRRLTSHLAALALQHRTVGGHRLASNVSPIRLRLLWSAAESPVDGVRDVELRDRFQTAGVGELQVVPIPGTELTVTLAAQGSTNTFAVASQGLGIAGGQSDQVDQSEAISIQFNRDVLVESASIVAGDGSCGGFYRVGDKSPLAIYCVDADIDSQDQSGVLSDIGILRAGETLRLDSAPHYGVEAAGSWWLSALNIRPLASAADGT